MRNRTLPRNQDRSLPYFRSPVEPMAITLALGTVIFLSCLAFRPFQGKLRTDLAWPITSLVFAGLGLLTSGINHLVLLWRRPLASHRGPWPWPRVVGYAAWNAFSLCGAQILLATTWLSLPLTWTHFSILLGFAGLLSVFPLLTMGLLQYLNHSDQIVTPPDLNACPPPDETLQIPAANGKTACEVSLACLSYVESVGNYVKIWYWSEDRLRTCMVRNKMLEIEKCFSSYPEMLRCHRSYMVNLRQVTSIKGNSNGYKISLSEVETEIPVSRSFTQKVKEVVIAWPSEIELPGSGHWSRS